jgi:integrase
MQGSIRKRGDKWYYSFELAQINGKRKRVERVGGRTKKEASAAMHKAMSNYAQSGQPFDESHISVADYFDFWLENFVKPNKRINTYNLYQSLVKNHIKPKLGQYHLKHLTPAAVQNFFTEKRGEGLSDSTLAIIRAVMSSGLKMAVHPYQYIPTSPMKYVSLTRKKKELTRDDLKLITTEQYSQIMQMYPYGSDFYIPFQVAYHTGLRSGEVCALTWERVNFKEKTIQVRQTMFPKKGGGYELGPPKSDSSFRTVAISDHLTSVLMQQKKDQNKNRLKYGPHYNSSDFICTRESGKVVTRRPLEVASKRVEDRLCFAFSFHSLRHTHATTLLASGANMKAVQRRLGHAKLSITMDTYAHVTKDMEASLRGLLDDFVNATK